MQPNKQDSQAGSGRQELQLQTVPKHGWEKKIVVHEAYPLMTPYTYNDFSIKVKFEPTLCNHAIPD